MVHARTNIELRKKNMKEYLENNYDKIKEYQYEYRKSNTENQKEYMKTYRKENVEKKRQLDKQYYINHKNDIYNCSCGAEISKWCLSRHLKTKKHNNFEQSKKDE